jgi:hypothetical protein
MYGASLLLRAVVSVVYGESWVEALTTAATSFFVAAFVITSLALVVRGANASQAEADRQAGEAMRAGQATTHDILARMAEDLTAMQRFALQNRDAQRTTRSKIEAQHADVLAELRVINATLTTLSRQSPTGHAAAIDDERKQALSIRTRGLAAQLAGVADEKYDEERDPERERERRELAAQLGDKLDHLKHRSISSAAKLADDAPSQDA